MNENDGSVDSLSVEHRLEGQFGVSRDKSGAEVVRPETCRLENSIQSSVESFFLCFFLCNNRRLGVERESGSVEGR
jgi:hypothetical protein